MAGPNEYDRLLDRLGATREEDLEGVRERVGGDGRAWRIGSANRSPARGAAVRRG